ncbi:YdcH family protein [Lacimicrobium sp. SS2-24]|uniref:YdcH family protein n=1 Tax=Lacimicrobium sp. SS2-24 TaxID=2005569 RepID=UPI000B4AB0A8|nr:YdcH family protein [Lacimicrobium sp. SS2-24]
MPLEKHPLQNEFPQHQSRIQQLHANDSNFARLSDKYHQLDKEIFEIEQQNLINDEDHLEQLKLKRLQLKDQLYHMLDQHSA